MTFPSELEIVAAREISVGRTNCEAAKTKFIILQQIQAKCY
jgi:hypothetical protein